MTKQDRNGFFLVGSNDQKSYGRDDFENDDDSKDNDGGQKEIVLICADVCSHSIVTSLLYCDPAEIIDYIYRYVLLFS